METRIQQLWQRGLGHFQEGNLVAAQACFEGILARDPQRAPAFFRLALIYFQRGELTHAAALAEQALALGQEKLDILALLARICLAAGRVAMAREYAHRAALLPRDSAGALDALGVVFSQLGEHARALEMFDSAIALAAPSAELYFDRAMAQAAAGAHEAFELDLEACLGLDPDHAKSHFHLARQRRRGLSPGHADFLRKRLRQLPARSAENEIVSLALFHELDGLGRHAEAWNVLEGALATRSAFLPHESMPWESLRALQTEPLTAPTVARGPIFVVGLPRSGVAVLAGLLERHPDVRSHGSAPVFQRRLNAELSRSLGRPSFWPLSATALGEVDFEALGRDYMTQVGADDDAPILEAAPMNAMLLGAIARALPRARFLHLTRDLADNALSLLALPRAEAGLRNNDIDRLAEDVAGYDDLMLHWQEVLPGRIMDVQYESLVQKPEMVLRVACVFLGLRFQSSMVAHDLHERRVGRALPYADQLASWPAGQAGGPGLIAIG